MPAKAVTAKTPTSPAVSYSHEAENDAKRRRYDDR